MARFCLAVVLAASAALAFGEAPRLVSKVIPGTSTVVVAAEGALEPRSVGSYTVTIYAGADRRHPYDDFVAGVVRPRNGTLAGILLADLDRDGSPEIVVVIRSAGTGNYISADAFRLQGVSLSLVESVSGLAKDADPVAALEARLAKRAESGGAPNGVVPRR